MIYLAIPYSDPNPLVMDQRFEIANRVAAKLFAQGSFVFSPISHGHPMARYEDLPTDFDFWSDYCLELIMHCDEMVVIMAEGWRDSVGVQEEIRYASMLKIPVTYMEVT